MTLEEYHRQNIQMSEQEFKRFVNGVPCGITKLAVVDTRVTYCGRCRSYVRNKAIFGSLHVCV